MDTYDREVAPSPIDVSDRTLTNELRWRGRELGLREDEIVALLAQGVAVAERQLEALDIGR
jgi:hypothetical protein